VECTQAQEISKRTATKTATRFCVAVLTAEQLTLNPDVPVASKRSEEHPQTKSTDYASENRTAAHEIAPNPKKN